VKTSANSLVIPVYRNAVTIEALVAALEHIAGKVTGGFEVVFVIDGTPDNSRQLIWDALGRTTLQAQIVDHSRNFGSFAAIRTGMQYARGQYIAVMAADLQEPPELALTFFERLGSGDVDVVAGERRTRSDRGSRNSGLYWRVYRRFVMPDMPAGGVDMFGCTEAVRDVILTLESVNTSLVAQLFWVGFRRELVPYDRLPREGKSGWTLSKKVRYLSDSVFAFTDLPVHFLWGVGAFGVIAAIIIGIVVLIGRIVGFIHLPGYAPTVLVIAFFGSLNMLGLGVMGSYVWRAYESVKGRPGAIVSRVVSREVEGGE
jgi:glycosyltransferase involved in cell wall biosynthesis